MQFRVAAYDPFTNVKIPLPKALQIRAVYNLNSLNSLDITYPVGESGYERINTNSEFPAELTLEYYDKSVSRWVEPMGSRFIVMKAEGDHVEELPVKKYSALSLKWLYRKAKVWPAKGSAEERVFKDVTIGKMLRTIFSDAYSRGIKIANPSLMDFTDTKDSGGSSWGGTVSMSFPVNMSLEEMLNNLVEQGYIDWDMNGRRTQVWKAESPAGLSRNNTDIRLLNVYGVTGAPEQVNYESLMTDARVLGENKTWEFKNDYNSPWGRLEEVISQSGINDPITAEEATQKILMEGKKPSRVHTKEFSGTSIITPLKDIRVGDWVTAQTKDELGKILSEEEMRIQEISLDISGRDFTWNVSLGDRTTDFLEKLARRQNSASGGSSSGTSRTPSGSPSIMGDFRIPTVPSSFSVSATSRLDAETGIYKGRLTMSWFDDMMGVDPEDGSESPQARRNYDIQWRVLGDTEWTTLGWFPPDSQRATYYPVDVINPKTKKPYTYEFKIRTIGPETQSAYSKPVMVQMLADQTPPPKPSKPTATANLGVVFVAWDKKSSSGEDMPLDFSHALVESRHYADTEVVREVGRIYGDALTIPNLEEGVPFSYRLIAVDTAGNRSVASEWSDPITILPLVDAKSISAGLEDANTRLNEVAEDARKKLDDLNSHLTQSFVRIDEDIEAIRSAANSPDVFAQPEPPENPSEGQLWIDTDNNNVIHVFDKGSWVIVSADAAEDLLAKKVPIVIHATSPASDSSSAPNGSTWFQHAPTISDPVVAQWSKTNGKWVSVVVSSEVIANLDVGKLTAGTASLSTAVVDKLFANIFAAKKITATELAISPGSLWPDPGFERTGGYNGWEVVNGGLEKEGTGTQSGSYFPDLKIAVEPGESYIFSFNKEVLSGNPGASAVGLYLQMFDSKGNRTHTALKVFDHASVVSEPTTFSSSHSIPAGSAYMAIGLFTQPAVQPGTRVRVTNLSITKKVGTTVIADGAVTSTHITASESLTAKVAQFLKITSDMIEANQVTAAHLEAGSVKAYHMDFVSEDPVSGGSMTLNSSGLTLARDGSTIFQLTNNSVDTVSLTSEEGDQVVTLDNEGGIAGIEGSFESLSVDGLDLKEFLEAMPRGIIARAYRTENPPNTQYSTRNDQINGIIRVEFDVRPGYAYRIQATGLRVHIPVDDMATRARFNLHLRTNADDYGPAETTSWIPYYAVTGYRSAGSSSSSTVSLDYIWGTSREGTASVLVSYQRLGGPAGTEGVMIDPTSDCPINLTVWEENLVGRSGKDDYLGSIPSSGVPDPKDKEPAPRRVTQTWTASATQSWRNDMKYTSTTPGYRGNHLWQGRWSGDPQGFKKSHAVFGSAGSKGQTLAQARSKMTEIEKLEVYLYCGFFHGNSGGTARLWFHGSSSTNSFPSTTLIGNYKFKRGQGRWIEIKDAGMKKAFLDGRFTGFALDAGSSTSHSYYGYFRGAGSDWRSPKIRATYLTK